MFKRGPFFLNTKEQEGKIRREEIYGTYRLIIHCLAITAVSFFQPFLCFVLFFHSKKYFSEHQMIFIIEVWFHQCTQKKHNHYVSSIFRLQNWHYFFAFFSQLYQNVFKFVTKLQNTLGLACSQRGYMTQARLHNYITIN